MQKRKKFKTSNSTLSPTIWPYPWPILEPTCPEDLSAQLSPILCVQSHFDPTQAHHFPTTLLKKSPYCLWYFRVKVTILIMIFLHVAYSIFNLIRHIHIIENSFSWLLRLYHTLPQLQLIPLCFPSPYSSPSWVFTYENHLQLKFGLCCLYAFISTQKQ